MNTPYLSIIVPMYNEEESVCELINKTIDCLNSNFPNNYEIVIVDDGSTDNGALRVEQMFGEYKYVHLIELVSNFGQSAAIAAGIGRSVGAVIVLIDADGQNDPIDIDKLVFKLNDGYECVSGRRVNRQDNLILRKIPSKLANFLLRKITRLNIHDFGCTLKAYNGNLLRSIPLYGDMHRLLPYYIYLNGGSVTELYVNHHPRLKGKSKYGLSRTFKILPDVFTARFINSFSTKPMQFFGNISFVLIFSSGLLLITSLFLKFYFNKDFVETPLPLLAGIIFLSGLQIALLGLITEIFLRRSALNDTSFFYKTKNSIKKT